MPGQLRLRVLPRPDRPVVRVSIVSPEEMAEIVEGTGWEIRHLIQDEGTMSPCSNGVAERAHRRRTRIVALAGKKSDCGRGLAGVFEQRPGMARMTRVTR